MQRNLFLPLGNSLREELLKQLMQLQNTTKTEMRSYREYFLKESFYVSPEVICGLENVLQASHHPLPATIFLSSGCFRFIAIDDKNVKFGCAENS